MPWSLSLASRWDFGVGGEGRSRRRTLLEPRVLCPAEGCLLTAGITMSLPPALPLLPSASLWGLPQLSPHTGLQSVGRASRAGSSGSLGPVFRLRQTHLPSCHTAGGCSYPSGCRRATAELLIPACPGPPQETLAAAEGGKEGGSWVRLGGGLGGLLFALGADLSSPPSGHHGPPPSPASPTRTLGPDPARYFYTW